jgi:hypothetical protein
LDEAIDLVYFMLFRDPLRGWGKMRIFPLACILVAMTVAAICQIILAKTLTAGPPSAVAEAEVIVESQSSVVVAVTPAVLSAP